MQEGRGELRSPTGMPGIYSVPPVNNREEDSRMKKYRMETRASRVTGRSYFLWFCGRALPLAAIGMCAMVVAAGAQNQNEGTKERGRHEARPYWAYAVNPESGAADAVAKAVDETPIHVTGSAAAFTRTQIGDLYQVPDWHPAGHPAMPGVVAHGRKPEVFACGYCHLPNGQGRPENSSLAGLPADYIVEQMEEFKRGLRKSSEPRHKPTATMIAYETKASDEEIQAAAAYFSGLKAKRWIRVVETKTVPKTHVAGWMLVASEGSEMEPIGNRIIETPENLEQTELRNDASGFIAYVPVGSIKKGRALVTTGGAGKTIACAACHGSDLRGMGNVPSIAGRSPSYIVRQLYDMRSGARTGAKVQLMKAPVANLTMADMVTIAAYVASLQP
jgi:cytochrome c553